MTWSKLRLSHSKHDQHANTDRIKLVKLPQQQHAGSKRDQQINNRKKAASTVAAAVYAHAGRSSSKMGGKGWGVLVWVQDSADVFINATF